MQFLGSGAEIESVLTEELRECEALSWAVAWASLKAPLAQLLSQHKSKIRQLTVGTHFYQTDPRFIEEFLGQDGVSFVMNPSGVYHPKLYYFSATDGRWVSVVGSPNLTGSAFTANAEVAVRISSDDVGADQARKKILAGLSNYARLGRSVTHDELAAYSALWKRQQSRIGSLAGTYETSKKRARRLRSPLDVPLFKASWTEYFETVKSDKKHTTSGRLTVLEEAGRLFAEHGSFGDIGIEGRRGIAGFGRTDEVDWLWFGSMKGHGLFMQAVNANSRKISEALDEIPLTGAIERGHYDAFLVPFRTAFERVGVATASRLLAMKRPDYFVCLDSKNKRALCSAFGISQSVDLDNYWPKVIARILDSNWWSSSEPSGGLSRRIWRSRAAFLDVRFYSPD